MGAKSGSSATDPARPVHSDFERGFICAETIACGGEQKAKESGKMRQEGRDYVVRDGDVMLFQFNVQSEARRPQSGTSRTSADDKQTKAPALGARCRK